MLETDYVLVYAMVSTLCLLFLSVRLYKTQMQLKDEENKIFHRTWKYSAPYRKKIEEQQSMIRKYEEELKQYKGLVGVLNKR